MQVTKEVEEAFAKEIPENVVKVLEATGLISCTEKRNYCLCVRLERKVEGGYTFASAIGIVLRELHLDLSHRQVRNIYDDGRKRFKQLKELSNA